MQFGVLFEVLVALRAQLCEIDDRVLGGMQFGVLVQVLCWGAGAGAIWAEGARGHAVWGAGGCC